MQNTFVRTKNKQAQDSKIWNEKGVFSSEPTRSILKRM